MITKPVQLFFLRLKNEWRYQYNVWKTAVDWIVWLYILLPMIAFFVYQYYLIWQGQAGWLESYPLEFSWFFFFYLSTKGTIRLFLEEGDLLFLRQNKRWLDGLMRLGVTYSFLQNLLLIIIVSALLFPIWYVYEGVTVSKIVIFVCFVYFFRLCLQFIKQILEVTFQHWKLLLVNFALQLVSFVIFLLFYLVTLPLQLLITGGLIFLVVVLYKKRMMMKSCFYDDCIRETQERLKLTYVFIAISGYKVEKGKPRRKKPVIFFSNSAQLFRKRTNSNLITETLIKYVVRNKTRMLIIIQLTIVCVVALVVVPNWVKIMLIFVSSYSVIHIVRSFLKEVKTHSFFFLLTKEKGDELRVAEKKAVFLLTSPSNFLFGFAAGWATSSAMIGLGAGVVFVALNYFLTKLAIY